jgi:hypothetical protein
VPDPIDELEGFTMPGTTTPLPPAEVRRRGDRIRRRNHVLAAAGGLAAVAAVATPITAVALSHGPDRPEPMPAPAVTWRQDIPDTVDVGAVPAGSPVTFTVRRDGSVVDDFTLCGKPAFSTRSTDPAGPAVDTAGATYAEPGTSSSAGRTLAVYRDADAAAAAAEGLRSAVAGCPVDEHRGGPTYTWATVPGASVDGADEGFVVAQQVQLDPTTLSDLTAIEVARVGNALLLSETHTSAGGQQAIDGTVPSLLKLSAPVVEQMCVFAAEPCGGAR